MAIVRQFSFIPASYTPYLGELTNRTPTSYKVKGTELSSIWYGSGLKYNGAGNAVVAGTLNSFMFEKAGKIVAAVEGLHVTIKSLREGVSPGEVLFAGNDKFFGHGGTDYVSLALGNDTYYGVAEPTFFLNGAQGKTGSTARQAMTRSELARARMF